MTNAPKKRARGRPALTGDVMVQINARYPQQMVDAIDEIIAGRMDRPDRSSVIRELLAEALAARSRKGGKR